MAFPRMTLSPIFVSLGSGFSSGSDQRLSNAYSMVHQDHRCIRKNPDPCSGYRLLSQQFQARVALLRPGATVQLTLASKNRLDFSVTVDRPNRFTYGPAINSDCSSYFDSGISPSLTKIL